MRIKQQLHGLPSYKPGKPMDEVKKELGLERVIKLASNENPYGSSLLAQEAIAQLLNGLAIYPDGYAAILRKKVATHLGVEQNQLIFGNGSDEVIQMLCRALLTKEHNIVTADPTFSQYKLNAIIEGAEVKEVPLKDGVHQLDEMLKVIDEQTKIIWVCNPNNPTGTYVTEKAFLSFLEKVPKHVLVVSDEAYYEYVEAKDYPETVRLLKEYENLVILRTFSKAYGLASLRVGYGVGHPHFIQSLDPVRPPFNNTSLAHVAAAKALDDQDFISNCVQKNAEEKKRLVDFCEKENIPFFPSQTNFLLMDLNKKGNDVFDYFLRKGMIIRSGEALGFPTYIRVTIGTKEENDVFLEVLKAFLEETK